MERGFNGFSRILKAMERGFCGFVRASAVPRSLCASVPLCENLLTKEWKLYTLPTFIICQKDFHTEAQRHRGNVAQQTMNADLKDN
ncbi:MAG: hypothetical protein FWG87_03990 [Defluviitaleaceae bacterium]|nr:hypothetical protein [Defluviitaleaceae bacterium]